MQKTKHAETEIMKCILLSKIYFRINRESFFEGVISVNWFKVRIMLQNNVLYS